MKAFLWTNYVVMLFLLLMISDMDFLWHGAVYFVFLILLTHQISKA